MPFDSYMKSIGLKKKDYKTAIGIRADEFRRVNKKAAKQNIIYPLIETPTTKLDVLNWWKDSRLILILWSIMEIVNGAEKITKEAFDVN